VFEPIAQFARVVSYDRASLGGSDRGPRRRSCADMVADLHALLLHAHIPGPYVLVGHSFGGQIVRLFAHHHPSNVVGLVLVDAVHHDQTERALALIPPPAPDESPRLANMRTFHTDGYTDDPAWDPEGIDLGASDAQVRAAGLHGALPLIVLTARDHGAPPPDLPADFIAAYDAMFHELQRDLARLSSRSAHIYAEHSGHFIQIDEPALVIDAVRQVVAAARGE